MQKKLIFDYETSKQQQIILKSNLGAFYRYVNRKLHSSSGVGILKSSAGDMIIDGSEKATLLNNYFSSVFTQDDGNRPPFSRRVHHRMLVWKISISRQHVS